jgi:hypothetical protein
MGCDIERIVADLFGARHLVRGICKTSKKLISAMGIFGM